MVQQDRAQSRAEFERQDAAEREDRKQLDQLKQKQKAIISATTVEPKVNEVQTKIENEFFFFRLVSRPSSS